MKRILLIEDDENIRKMLRLSLESYGYAVTEACDGKQGLASYRASPADLVITDLVMPEKEGLETIRDLRKANPLVKIIAMSGGSRSSAGENLKMAKLLGAAALISKPFEMGKFAETIAGLLGKPPPDAAVREPAPK
jgi:DNA-binding response OmpR family regulator